jgi:tRNA pseudouridine synthase 10
MTLGKTITNARRILRKYTLCDWCLGRQFAMQGYGLTNKERGMALKTLLLMTSTETYQKNQERGITLIHRLAEHGQYQPARDFLTKEGITDTKPSRVCDVCQGVMDRLTEAAQPAIQSLQDWEITSLLIGTQIDPTIIETEEQLRSEFQIVSGEPIKAELNREIGKLVTDAMGVDVNFESPDVVVLIHIPKFSVDLDVRSLFIFGYYRKLKRGIPQTRWPCRECGGKGCKRCKNTGKMYAESVEELIAPVLLKFTQGNDVKFHGAGREDIDALMLGDGRPFVMEILTPHKRSIDLEDAAKRINKSTKGKVKVRNLRFANKAVVQKVKDGATTSKKVYKALVHVESPISQDKLQMLQNVSLPLEVNQRTPQRVLHRRADRTRKKRIHTLEITPVNSKTCELIIGCQGGLYVKEFISGDEGRTIPSIAELLGTPAVCKQLDVLLVEIKEDQLPW